MKKLKKITIVLAFMITLLAGMLITANAAGVGTMVSNALQADFGQTYFKSWTKNTDHLNYYVKIDVPSRGLITITATKPYDSEGEYGKLEFSLYDGETEPVWGADTDYSVDNPSSSYKFNVGLDAGTYYLTIKPGFYVTSGVIETNFSINHTPGAYYEMEPNSSIGTATPLTIGKTTVGYYGADGRSYADAGDVEDWYSATLQAGYEYEIAIGNYSKITNTTTIFEFIGTDGKEVSKWTMDNQINSDGMNYILYTPKTTGNCYLRFHNYHQSQVQYSVRVSGGPLNGWQKSSGYWYYYKNNAKMTGWQEIEGAWYYFDSTGKMQTGWLLRGSNYYYLNSSGVMQTGWTKVGQNWYYMNTSGIMQTGWLQRGANWYFLNKTGYMQTGWLQRGTNYYYMNSSGIMQTGWTKVGKHWYFMNTSGIMQTGWLQQGESWYFLNDTGYMQTGWMHRGENWYYFESSGKMVTGERTINGTNYRFNDRGQWIH